MRFDGRSRNFAKRIWASPAGKARLARRLVKLLPPHDIYVEPFVGSGAVLFAKQPAACEVINDVDPDIVTAFRTIKRLRPEELSRLRRYSWLGDKDRYRRVNHSSPKTDLDRLYRFLYLARFSFGRQRGQGIDSLGVGQHAKVVDRVERFQPRLKDVKIRCGDYRQVMRQFDSPTTVHFLDPPYVGYYVRVGERNFDEETFLSELHSLKGKFLLTYGSRGTLPKKLLRSRFDVRRIRTVANVQTRHRNSASMFTQLVVANYNLPRYLR